MDPLVKTIEKHNLGFNSMKTIMSFVRFARAHGMNVGLGEAKSALNAAEKGLMINPESFKYTLKSIFCGTQTDIDNFETVYELFWAVEGGRGKNKVKIKNEFRQQEDTKSSLILIGNKGGSEDQKEIDDAKTTSGSNTMEKMRKTDFTKLEDIDNEYFEKIASQLYKQMSLRMRRRMKAASRGENIHFGKTIRRSISKGGWPSDLVFSDKKYQKKRLVMLLDVSGSMDKYSFYLLKFIVVLKHYFERIEAFTFSTELNHITPHLNHKDLKKVLRGFHDNVQTWSSGTRIGECLREFNQEYSKQVLSRSSIVIVLSDGLDTGEPEILEDAIRKIKMKTKQLIWLNPLKAMKGYEPIQKGMSSALPMVDEFQSAHNLNSLLELENYLAYV